VGTRIRVEIISAGVLEILKLPTVQADLDRRGHAILAALPTNNSEEWVVNSFLGRDRAQTVVKTANREARQTAAEDNALQRAVDAGR
jgi:hypothetical protein